MSQQADAAWLDNLVGQELVKKSGADGVSPLTQVSTSELKGKHILLYFSATWCTPCKKFTPQLVDFYTKTKERLNLEIIFISLDRDATVHAEYFSRMPWLAQIDLSKCQKVATGLHVMSIPSLVVFSPEGQVITRAGVRSVITDPEGAKFPWEGSGDSEGLNFMQMVLVGVLVLVLLRAISSHFL